MAKVEEVAGGEAAADLEVAVKAVAMAVAGWVAVVLEVAAVAVGEEDSAVVAMVTADLVVVVKAVVMAAVVWVAADSAAVGWAAAVKVVAMAAAELEAAVVVAVGWAVAAMAAAMAAVGLVEEDLVAAGWGALVGLAAEEMPRRANMASRNRSTGS